MNEKLSMVEIRINIQSAVIILLAVVILVFGAYNYRNTKEESLRLQIEDTQKILNFLSLDENIAQAFNNIGYEVKNIRRPLMPDSQPQAQNNDTDNK